VGSFCVFGLRLVARSVPPELAQLPKIEQAPFVFALGSANFSSPLSREAYAAVMKMGPQVIPAVEVRPTPEQTWVIFDSREPERNEDLYSFDDFLKEFKPARLMIIVHSREVAAATSLLAVTGERPDPMVTFIFSPNHRLNREFTKKRPLWLSGGDASLLAQWHVFAALFLEPMRATDFDWYFSGGHLGLQKPFAPRVQSELGLRQVGEIQVLEDASEKLDENLYGVLTNRPTAVLQRFISAH
jgi:hypothetical protein